MCAVEFVPCRGGGVVEACLDGGGQGGGVGDVGRLVGVEVGGTRQIDDDFVGAGDGDAVLAAGHGTALVDHLEAGAVGDGLQFAGKLSAVGAVGRGGVDAGLARYQGEAQRHLTGLAGLVACGDDLCGVAHEVGAVVADAAVGVGEGHAARGVRQVEHADIVLDHRGLRHAQFARDFLGEERTEVFVVAIVGAVVAAASAPEGFLVKLYLVGHDATQEAAAQLAVTQRQRILCPLVANGLDRARRVVPQREFVLRGECGDARYLEVGILHLVGVDEEQGVVVVALVGPEADAHAGFAAAPLVEHAGAVVGLDAPCRGVCG